jgi:hypothetical protein
MNDGPCPEHPGAPMIGGLCGACTIMMRIGVVSMEFMAPLHDTGCRSTIHCANYGFCDRCSPELADASSHVLRAMKAIGRETDGHLYAQLMDVLKEKVTE